MKLNFDVSTIEYKIIHEILTRQLNLDYKVWVFGSRVKNQVKYNSDLDLAIEYPNKLDIKLLRKIKRELEESKLPFKVDVLDLNTATEEFKALIEKDMISFPLNYLNRVPTLRFKEFRGEWEEHRADFLLDRYSNPVEVNALEEYRQIGTRSHGKGIFHKERVTGKELGNKRVFWVHEKALVINIVFAWEHSIALTSEREKGFIASHRFPMYLPKENRCNLNFLLEFFLRKYGKYLLGLASPGGAGRNKTLGQSNFNELKLIVPSIKEQERIIGFLSLVDQKIEKVTEQLSLLEEYKKGVMQKIFSQEIRFKDDNGGEFEDWKKKQLGDVFYLLRGSSLSKSDLVLNGKNKCIHYGELFTVYSEKIFQVKSKTNLVDGKFSKKGDILMPSSDITPKGLATASALMEDNILIGGDTNILRPKYNINSIFISYFLNINKKEIMRLVTGTIIKHIYNKDIATLKINLAPLNEQIKIANFLTKIDQRIEASKKQLEESKEYKKALLQQMFI